MATVSPKTTCVICNKSKITYICQGCSQHFCLDHLPEHRKNLGQQLEEIQNDHDQLRQDLMEQQTDRMKHSLIKQIDQWEKDSIEKIQQTAQLCRDKWIGYSNRFLQEIEKKLNGLAQQINEINQENEFTEIDLNHLKQRVVILQEQFHHPSNFVIKQQSTSFIQNISLSKSFDIGKYDENFPFFNCYLDTQWEQSGTTIGGEIGRGNQLDQLSAPYGICIDQLNRTLYVADYKNARIMEWRPNTTQWRIVAGGNELGNRSDQLNEPADVVIDQENDCLIIADRGNRRVMRWPRRSSSSGQVLVSDIDCSRLAIHKDGSLYVSDHKKNEVRRWRRGEVKGTVVAGGNGQGNRLNQLHNPTHLFVNDDHTLYISDRNNHRVMKWMKDAKEGIIVAGGNDQGNQMAQLSFPAGVVVDQFGQIYVADMDNNRVMRWSKEMKTGTIVVGGNSQGNQANELNYPLGLSLDNDGTLYVSDCENHRIQKFDIQ